MTSQLQIFWARSILKLFFGPQVDTLFYCKSPSFLKKSFELPEDGGRDPKVEERVVALFVVAEEGPGRVEGGEEDDEERGRVLAGVGQVRERLFGVAVPTQTLGESKPGVKTFVRNLLSDTKRQNQANACIRHIRQLWILKGPGSIQTEQGFFHLLPCSK